VVLTDEGEVLSFGWGVHGRLGHGDAEDQLVPKVIEALNGVRAVAIAAGAQHSMVLTDEGEVLSFGNGDNGVLGHSDLQHVQSVPKVIEALQLRSSRRARLRAAQAGGGSDSTTGVRACE